LASYFGASKIVCIGIDMDYSGAVSFSKDTPNIWPDFSYETHCKSMFVLMRAELERMGIELINSTLGGKVDDLPRQELSIALGK
jgi:hypothetical protein